MVHLYLEIGIEYDLLDRQGSKANYYLGLIFSNSSLENCEGFCYEAKARAASAPVGAVDFQSASCR